MHSVAGLDLDAKVVDGAPLPGFSSKHQLQRRFGDGEVGVALLDLVGRGVEQLRVERHGLVEVVDIECEMNARLEIHCSQVFPNPLKTALGVSSEGRFTW